jgi:NitT/TauT family transport system substrate-binding protein
MTKFLTQAGLAKTQPDFNKLFDDRFVKAYAEKSKKA